MFDDVVVDEFGWIRDREDPDTIPLLESENAHTDAVVAPLQPLIDEIFTEIRTRTQETDLSAPTPWDDWWYAARTEEGAQYPVLVRMHGAPDGPEQVVLDVNALADGHDYFALGLFAVSPDHRLVAYSVDTDGSESYTLRVRDIDRGSDLADVVEGTYASGAWSTDGEWVFYTTLDASHRPDRVWRHRLGTPSAEDVEVFHEADERMYLFVSTTSDRSRVLVSAGSQITADVHHLDASDPTGSFSPVLPREHGVQYTVDHRDGRWLVVTDRDAPNGMLLSVAVDDPDDVVPLVPHRDDARVKSVRAFRDHIVVSGRSDGLTSLTVVTDDGSVQALDFDEAVYAVGVGQNRMYDTTVLRITYQSMVTPPQVIDIDLATGQRTLVKETPVLGGYDPSRYESERTWATSEDGTHIPISVVRLVGSHRPGPLMLYGYGSYEVSTEPTFSIARLSLLDRGVTYAIAHVRGGGEMGRQWYEQGKLAHKSNTFTDFVACARHLVETGETTPAQLGIRGGSAGGLLVGAAANLAPELFSVVLAHVPFVDVTNTMLDDTLPLTVIEYEEWGNPTIEDQYRWIRSYAPYENVAEGASYPAVYVTAGLNDPRVPYWEAAKWVARLRASTHPRGPVVLRTEMGAGHGGRSGRYDAWREEAEALGFALSRIGAS